MTIEQLYGDLWNLQAQAWSVAADLEEKLQQVGPALEAIKATTDSLSAANVSLQAQLDTARASIASKDAEIAALKAKLEPVPPPAPVVKTVRDYGAKLDGITDDTVAIQKAIDAGDGRIPALNDQGQPSRALINALRVPFSNTAYGLLVGAGKRLEMEGESALVVRPNAAPRYQCVRVVDGGVMSGGQVLGDRKTHTYTAGSSHEWGYGVFVSGRACKLLNVSTFECTGDGVGVTGPDHLIVNVISKRNRRNGLSAFRSDNLVISGGEYSDTGHLTDSTGLPGPFAGIDVEPDNGNANVKIERVKCFRNQKAGIVFWVRDEVASRLEGLVTDVEVSGSPNSIWGADEAVRDPTVFVTVLRSKLQFGSGAAVKADRGSRFVVGDANLANANTIDSATGSRAAAVSYGIQQPNGGVATKGQNTYV